MELYTFAWVISNTAPILAWIALKPFSPSGHLSVSLTLHSSSYKLFNHWPHQSVWQFSSTLILRHRLSVTQLILVNLFKLHASLKNREFWVIISVPLALSQRFINPHIYKQIYCNLDKIMLWYICMLTRCNSKINEMFELMWDKVLFPLRGLVEKTEQYTGDVQAGMLLKPLG